MEDGSARGGAIQLGNLRLLCRTGGVHATRGVDAHFGAPVIHTRWPAYPLARQGLVASPHGRPWHSSHLGCGGERPPRPRACYGRGARCVFTRWPPPSGGRSQSMDPLAGRPSSAAVSGVSTDRSGFRVSALVGQVRGSVEGQAVHGAEAWGLIALHAVRRTRGS